MGLLAQTFIAINRLDLAENQVKAMSQKEDDSSITLLASARVFLSLVNNNNNNNNFYKHIYIFLYILIIFPKYIHKNYLDLFFLKIVFLLEKGSHKI